MIVGTEVRESYYFKAFSTNNVEKHNRLAAE